LNFHINNPLFEVGSGYNRFMTVSCVLRIWAILRWMGSNSSVIQGLCLIICVTISNTHLRRQTLHWVWHPSLYFGERRFLISKSKLWILGIRIRSQQGGSDCECPTKFSGTNE
jgi:hypothetical protein